MADNFKVPFTKVLAVFEHPNAEKLEYVKVFDFNVITQKGRYKIGDNVIYIPIDSVLSPEVEEILFPKGSKITLHKSRVKQIKIRGYYSQGMVADPESLAPLLGMDRIRRLGTYEENEDLATELNITKYEPPAPSFQQSSGPKLRNKPFSNPHFRTFNGITNIKWMPNVFEGEEVVIQCKLHGTHVRFGKAPFVPNTFWKKIINFFGLAPKYENVYGSNNVELTNRKGYTGFYGSDIYGLCLKKFDVFNKIKEGEFIHGEIIGPGIQKGYTYGHKEHHLVIFDVRVMQEDGTQRWLNPEEAEFFAKERGFDFVPVLYKGPFSKEIVTFHTSGPSVYCPEEKIREGCVVKARYNYDCEQSKRAYKSINPDYLNTDPSDNH